VRTENVRLPVVEIRAVCDCAGVDVAALKRYAERVMVETDNETCELSVLLADDVFVRDLNKRYRSVDRTTNVLAFPQQDAPQTLPIPKTLGDVVISLEKAGRDGAAAGHSLSDELKKLIVHGVLHLSGHDHRTQSQARRMRQLEQTIMGRAG
jgi:probable rRNA maturation factor